MRSLTHALHLHKGNATIFDPRFLGWLSPSIRFLTHAFGAPKAVTNPGSRFQDVFWLIRGLGGASTTFGTRIQPRNWCTAYRAAPGLAGRL
jgi:hypothetical protein